ncbi:MAG: hypothetical protein OXL68_13680 [Paracoccaceae bacterium]|nr:hypothetical protein [Paracoccaceae bacterium]
MRRDNQDDYLHCLIWECYFRPIRCLIKNVAEDPSVLPVQARLKAAISAIVNQVERDKVARIGTHETRPVTSLAWHRECMEVYLSSPATPDAQNRG